MRYATKLTRSVKRPIAPTDNSVKYNRGFIVSEPDEIRSMTAASIRDFLLFIADPFLFADILQILFCAKYPYPHRCRGDMEYIGNLIVTTVFKVLKHEHFTKFRIKF